MFYIEYIYCERRYEIEENDNFWSKPWVNPFGKIQVFDHIRWIFLWSRNSCFLCRTLKRVFYGLFRPKIRNGKNDSFWAQSWITTQEKSNFSTIDEGHFYSLEMRIFYVEYIQRVFYELVWLKRKRNNWPVFAKTMGNPFGKILDMFMVHKGFFHDINEFLF